MAASNASSNTTKTKSVKLLNSSLIPTILSHYQHKVHSPPTASVKGVIERAAKPFPTVQDLDKALLVVPLVWFQFSPILAYSPATSSDLLINFVFTNDQKKTVWTKNHGACELYKTFLSLSRTSPEVFGATWTTAGDFLPSPATIVWVSTSTVLSSSWVLVVKIV